MLVKSTEIFITNLAPITIKTEWGFWGQLSEIRPKMIG